MERDELIRRIEWMCRRAGIVTLRRIYAVMIKLLEVEE